MLLSNVIGKGGKACSRSTLVKYGKMGKFLHLAWSASQFRKIGFRVDYLSARATGADGGKRKSVKTGSRIIIFFCINLGLGGGWKYLNRWQMAPVASATPLNCPVAGCRGGWAAAAIIAASLRLISLTLLSPYSVTKLFCLKVVHILKYRYSYYAINSL